MVKKLLVLSVLLLVASLTACSGFCQSPEITLDVVYGHADGVDLKLDLARPRCGTGPFPAVVCIHGGAWQGGSKTDFRGQIKQFAENGYVAASVEYRMAPAHKWPAEIEDVKCSVRYLRAHAGELNIDPDWIFVTGASAGGHLALLLGLTDPKDGLEGSGGYPEQSSRVRAVANFFGPTDMRQWSIQAPEGTPEHAAALENTRLILENFLGTSDRNAPVVAEASPITHLDAGDSPIITFHGDKDDIVPVEQARLLHAALEKAGVRQKLVVMGGEGHGWNEAKMNGSLREALTFFGAHTADWKRFVSAMKKGCGG